MNERKHGSMIKLHALEKKNPFVANNATQYIAISYRSYAHFAICSLFECSHDHYKWERRILFRGAYNETATTAGSSASNSCMSKLDGL